MSVFGQQDLAMVVQLGAIGAGLTACGSGAAKVSVLGSTRAFKSRPIYGEESTVVVVRRQYLKIDICSRERPANRRPTPNV